MRNCFFSLSVLLLCFSTWATITPKIKIPEGFDENKFIIKEINETSPIIYNTIETNECSSIKYKEYFFLNSKRHNVDSNVPEDTPFLEWFCLFSVDLYNNHGFMPGLKEKVVYSKDEKLWVKVGNEKKYISSPYLDVPYKPIALYNVSSANASGYAVISENILPIDKERFSDEEIKKIIYFCMFRREYALCGEGDLVVKINGKETDLLPYALKSLESIEIGINKSENANRGSRERPR
ncbi:hypothetical protein ACK1C5_004383 [Salmonella enterica]